MAGAFAIVVTAVLVVGVLGAVVTLASNRRTWESFGRDHLVRDSDAESARGPSASDPRRDEEIRQMLDAANAHRRRRGRTELDVEAELARLTHPAPAGPPVDDELRREVRQLVLARHRRRCRRGGTGVPEPSDVDAEVEREIGRLSR